MGKMRRGFCPSTTLRSNNCVTITVRPTAISKASLSGTIDHATKALDKGALDLAEQGFRKILVADADHPEALLLLGETLRRKGDLGQAEALLRRVLENIQSSPLPYSVLHQTLLDAGRYADALEVIEQAVSIDPDNPDLVYKHALTLDGLGRLSDAVSRARHCLTLRPGWVAAASLEASALRVMGHGEQAVDLLQEMIKLEPSSASLRGQLVLSLHGDPRATLAQIAEATQQAWREIGNADTSDVSTTARPEKTLKIAYVSGDFREHPVAYFLDGVLNSHDRAAFHITLVPTFSGSDKRTAALRQKVDAWHPIFSLSDADAAESLRQLDIDIAIDLSGWTRGQRLGVFRRRIAPLQATWIGYSGTTGLDTMDYIICDHTVLPTDHEPHYSETPLRMPDSYVSMMSPSGFMRDFQPDLGGRPPPTPDRIVFGSFNTLAKLTDEILDAWVRILSGVDGSILLLRARQLNDDGVGTDLLARFQQRGISADRITLAGNSSRKGMLAAYRDVDIALDPFPYGGTTTTFETLCMGVPVVTLAGDRWVGLVGASVLKTIGLDELIAKSIDDYVTKATQLAHNIPRLTALRSRLQVQVENSPACDTAAFTRHLENALGQIWQNWCRAQQTG